MATRPSTRGSARSSARGGKAEESKESLSSAPIDRKAKLQADYASTSDDALTLRSAILALQSQIQQEAAQLTHFTHLKAQAMAVYEGEKERRRSLKLELKDRLADKSELQDSQRYELLVYKEKMKGLMGDHTEELNGVAVSQKEAEISSDLSHRTIESALMEDHRGLLYHSQQLDTQQHHLVHRLKLQHEEATMHMREHYERRSNHLRLHYQKQLKNQREQLEEHKKKSTSTLELKKNNEITALLTSQKRLIDDMKKYYTDITHANLELIKNLKEEVGDMKKKEASCTQEMRRIAKENEKLAAPLQENEMWIGRLEQQLVDFRLDKTQVEKLRVEDVGLTKEMEKVKWEVEVLTQKISIVREERNAMKNQMTAAQLSLAQVNDFSTLVMGKQLAILTAEVEKAEAGLSEVLRSSGVDGEVGGVLGRGLEEILLEKNRVIMGLEDEVKEWKGRFVKMMGEYEEEMRAYGIPYEELGFIPVKEI